MRFVLSLIISFLYDWIYFYIFFLFLYMAIFALSAMRNEKRAQGKLLCGAHKRTGLTEVLRSEYFVPHNIPSVLPSAGRYLPLFFCNQKKSRKTVKEKFRPLPSRSRVRLPPKGGINAPNIIKALVAPLPFSAHASACAILAFADGGSRNSSLHPPPEALGISTRWGPGRIFSFPRMPDRRRCFAPAEVIILIARQKAHTLHGG